MKRKNDEESNLLSTVKRRVVTDDWAKSKFRAGLFDEQELNAQSERYSKSQPYKHGVIHNLISPDLLRAVREEIQGSLSFTLKTTDIYRIYQSGDLANLDGLDDASLSRLPSLLKLRDALYSSAFRTYLSTVTGSGPLSGRKTDMAINVYTPGCHLLCHDDVIGSRRVSYILYLTDPDKPWKSDWGGALRLYPTVTVKEEDGTESKIPSPDYSVLIPPAFNQLSFFAVQPGESFHDVEEVYARQPGEEGEEVDGGRVRMAISGWYHIPQQGEEGYVEGLEEQLAEKSSLVQLQGKRDRFDLPESRVCRYDAGEVKNEKKDEEEEEEGEEAMTEQDLTFLLKYLAPTYLTPDTLEELSELFSDESCLLLERFLSRGFAEKLRGYIESEEKTALPATSAEIERDTHWRVARPPHKHRFLYQQVTPGDAKSPTPIQELLNNLLPSRSFRKWLSLATGLQLESFNVLARRFRRGSDYTLAMGYEDEEDKTRSRVELTLGVTPSKGWDDDGDDEDGDNREASKTEKSTLANGNSKGPPPPSPPDAVGGEEIYLAPDTRESAVKSDPAIYKTARTKEDDDDDDDEEDEDEDEDAGGVLVSHAPAWNRLGIVLRDAGVLRFVRFVGREAPGDRWDLTGEFGVR